MIVPVAAALWWIWPTPYQQAVIDGDTWRFNRLSRCAQVRTPIGWKAVRTPACPQPPPITPETFSAPSSAPVLYWTANESDAEIVAARSKLVPQLTAVRAWIGRTELGPTFHLAVHNDSVCRIKSLILAEHPVLGTLVPSTIFLDEEVEGDVLEPGQTTVLGFPVLAISDGEIPLDQLEIEWTLAYPAAGERRGCEDQ